MIKPPLRKRRAIDAKDLSPAEEDYIKAMYHLSEQGRQSVSTNALAGAIGGAAAAATDMLKRLSAKRLLRYKPYYGARITLLGKRTALEIIRRHRLWETFLVKTLGFDWEHIHEVAEELEHVRSERLIEKLDNFLGRPAVDPHGDPIPSPSGKMSPMTYNPLTRFPVGYCGAIAAVKSKDNGLLYRLREMGALPGAEVRVLNKEPYDNSMQIAIASKVMFISGEMAQNILLIAH